MSAVAAETAALGAPSVSRAWYHAGLALAAYTVAVLFLYRDAALGMLEIWSRSETFTHCYLIAPISLWLVWRKRLSLGRLRPAPSPTALIVVAIVGLAWLVGALGSVNALTQFALVALLVLGVPAILGYRIAAVIAFPMAFLFFSVPFGEFVMPQMMESTADFTVQALRASGIPVYREGLQFVIPSGNWSVVEACSGVRYLIASFTVGTLFAYLNYRSMYRRAAFMAVSLLVPILANWLRAYMIVMLGHLSSNRLAVGVDHLIYGWLFFGVVIMIMFALGARWSEDEVAEPATDPAHAGYERAGGGQSLPAIYTVAAFTMLAAVAPHLAETYIANAEGDAPVILARPADVPGWQVAGVPLANLRPAFENPSSEQHLTIRSADQAVGLYVAYFRHQGLGRKMISSNSVLVTSDDPHWAQTASGTRDIVIGAKPVRAKVVELRRGGLQSSGAEGRWLAWQVYWIDGRWTASDAMAKALTVWSRLRGRGDDSAVVLIYGRKGAQDPVPLLDAFATAVMPSVQSSLELTRASR